MKNRFLYCYGNDEGLNAQDCMYVEDFSGTCATCGGRIPPETTYLAIAYDGHVKIELHLKCAVQLGALLENFTEMAEKYDAIPNPPRGSKKVE